ncbi:MAG TPA: helix-turn-helix domain-containing protein [Bacteroidales bacterium]|nr:helix-turn-helix domain-containing protein [Bacteroidales bacterium]
MAHRTKSTPEEKVMLVKKYLAGEISATEVCEIVRVNNESFRNWIRIYKQEGSLGLINNGTNRRYSRELKINAVEAYLTGEGSQSEICKRYKIRSKKQLQDWIKLYNSGKNFKNMSGGSRMKSRNTSLEERIQIVRECIESGYDYGEIAKKYEVGYQQVYSWVKKFAEHGEAGLHDRRGRRKIDQEPRTPQEAAEIEIARLKHENYMLRMERDLLKKLEELERGDAFRK